MGAVCLSAFGFDGSNSEVKVDSVGDVVASNDVDQKKSDAKPSSKYASGDSDGSDKVFRDRGRTRQSIILPKMMLPDHAKSEEALQEFLQTHGVDTSQFGKGSAKSLQALLTEIEEGETNLTVQENTGKVIRSVEPVFIHVRAGYKLLVLTKQTLEDGRERKENLRVIAEKKGPGDDGIFSTALRGMQNALGVEGDFMQNNGAVQYREDLYGFEIESLDSPSYPGLRSIYRTHYVQFNVLDANASILQKYGLPKGDDFETEELTRLGTKRYFWTWMDCVEAQRSYVKKFAPIGRIASAHSVESIHSGCSVMSVVQGGTLEVPEKPTVEENSKGPKIKSEEDLKKILEADGVDCSKFGQGKAKQLDALFKEIQDGSSRLEVGADGKMCRTVEPVFLQLTYGNKVLVEKQQTLEDGKVRNRNMVLAEKFEPADPNLLYTALRGVEEEMGVLMADLSKPGNVSFRDDSYCMMLETMDSKSYPGVPCVYRTHYVMLEVLEAGLPLFAKYGLPGFEDFETEEHTKKGTKKMIWMWQDTEKCLETKVKGMLSDDTAGVPILDYKKALAWMPVEYKQFQSMEAVEQLLTMGKVDIGRWGDLKERKIKSLLQEIKLEFCALEKNNVTGQVRRVQKTAFIAVKQQGGVLVSKKPAAGIAGNLSEISTVVDADHGKEYFENLGVKLCTDEQDAVFYRSDLRCFEANSNEDNCFPGLPCINRTKCVSFN